MPDNNSIFFVDVFYVYMKFHVKDQHKVEHMPNFSEFQIPQQKSEFCEKNLYIFNFFQTT